MGATRAVSTSFVFADEPRIASRIELLKNS
jgi:hypothetical protein